MKNKNRTEEILNELLYSDEIFSEYLKKTYKSNRIVKQYCEIIPKKIIHFVINSGIGITPISNEIKWSKNEFEIKCYYVILDKNNYIQDLYLKGKHPNSNPDENNKFCLGDLKNIIFNEDNIEIIKSVLSTWNLRHCYFTPVRYVDYDYKESI